MKASKRSKLQNSGWRVSDTADFLNLSAEENAYINMKIALCAKLKDERTKKKLSQLQLAELISSSQSRVAKMEAGDPSVSIDLLLKTLLTLGVPRKQLAQAIAA